METGITEVEEAGSGPERPTRPSMVVPQARRVHAQGAIVARHPAFPQGVGDVPEHLELGDQLRPDRDHPDKQRNRRQRRRFFHEYPEHARLLIWEHKKNIVPSLFQESSAGSGSV